MEDFCMSPAVGNDLVSSMARFCAQHAEGNVQPLIKDVKEQLNQAMKDIAARTSELETLTAGLQKQMQLNEQATSASQKQANELVQTQAANEQMSQSRMKQVDDRVADVSNTLFGLGQSVKEHAAKLKAVDAEELAKIRQELTERVSIADMQKLSSVVDGKADVPAVQKLQASLSVLEVSVRQVEQHTSALEDLNTKTSEIEKAVQAKASNEDLKFYGGKTSAIEKAVEAKASKEELIHHRGILSSNQQDVEARISALQSAMQSSKEEVGKLSHSLERQMHEAVLSLEEQLADAGRSLQDKANVSQVRQLKDALEELKGFDESVKAMALDEVHNKADLQQMKQLEHTVLEVQQHVHAFDLLMQEKADASQLEHLKGSVLAIGANLAVVQESVHECSGMTKEFAKKADKSWVEQEITDKAGELYVNADFDKKRMKAYVDGEVLKKADVTYLKSELEKRPLKEEVANAVMSVLQPIPQR